jgi:hypothetical protein
LRTSLVAGLNGDVRMPAGQFKRAIVRAVIHDDQFDIAIVLLPNANQATFDRASRIVGRDDNRNERQLNPPYHPHASEMLFVAEARCDGVFKDRGRLVPRVIRALSKRLRCELSIQILILAQPDQRAGQGLGT